MAGLTAPCETGFSGHAGCDDDRLSSTEDAVFAMKQGLGLYYQTF